MRDLKEQILKIFPDPYKLAEEFAAELIKTINESAAKKQRLSVALSGGSTPEILFSLISEKYSDSTQWQYVHFFWGDERCVPPENPESNYGMTKRLLLSKIAIPLQNIHRIRGEDDPEREAVRYSEEISLNINKRDGIPMFDLVILGLGEDGHTASIFPGHPELMHSDKICEVAYHPVTMQKRITLTGGVINNAEAITFLVTGKKKQEVVEKLFKKEADSLNYPAADIVPSNGRLSWYVDKDAWSSL
jgi:6-phosphogluconolactonase